ncbi:aminotransferase class I/II-fold pyridoxal phosphate-dependent enzyme [Chlorobium phaeovibrioides]|uniref:Aminotransferase class I/II-fold pyridoxal phosphate-dependent enzyme n=1 Tax=Chlorobium phaeovibrioides TaxID=1094 RepID=A0A5M8IFB8_CHLPH|nr:aminotransferase class I/II-fold pyridoxal phosphate-dependent enzyme [Chlorobium phaeovibrioides]KAA6232989.1 aminotransferase class I/II-fold pyridoxal phosphate-dependent enzyme [Chlorobium phaeovibrioides]
MHFETLAIHDGQAPDPHTGSVTVPIYQTSTFAREQLEYKGGFVYSRIGNPTRQALEEALALLENGRYGLAFASGAAATMAALHLLRPGDHIVSGIDIYGGTYRIFEELLRPMGITTSYAEGSTTQSYLDACTPETRVIWVESPSNPLMRLADIRALAQAAHERGMLLAVDNTFLSPYFQRPLECGADIVIHSTTKYLAGHSDVLGGAVITNEEKLHATVKTYQAAAGAVPAPWDCWLVMRGLKTLKVRMKEHEANAMQLARFLESHPAVKRVLYPGLSSHPQHILAKSQMSGFGGMLTIEMKGGMEAVRKLISGVKLFLLADSLGGVESLIASPARMTLWALSPEERMKRGCSEGLVRISVGLEHPDDLQADLEQAIEGCG